MFSASESLGRLPIVAGPFEGLGGMMSNESAIKADSPLWTSAATTAEPFAQLPTPDDLAALAAQVEEEVAANIEERVRPYKTQVTQEMLSKPIK